MGATNLTIVTREDVRGVVRGEGAPHWDMLRVRWDDVVWEKGAPQVPPLRYASVGMTNLSVVLWFRVVAVQEF
jgi:hypothetical protein